MTASLILAAGLFAAAPEPPAADSPHAVYADYFVSNKAGLAGAETFLVITRPAVFDSYFQLAPPVGGGKRTPLPADAFDKGPVAAAVKRGTVAYTFKVAGVTLAGDTATVRYTADAQGAAGTATFASPLIVTLPKAATKVVFVENGKEVGTAEAK